MSENNVGFYSKMALLDGVLSQEPTVPTTVSKVAKILEEPAVASYVFGAFAGNLHPGWMTELSRLGYFRNSLSEDNFNLSRVTVGFLAGRVDTHPDVVADALLAADTTDDWLLARMWEIAKHLPDDLYAAVVEKLGKHNVPRFSIQDVAAAAAMEARHGNQDMAVQLFEQILDAGLADGIGLHHLGEIRPEILKIGSFMPSEISEVLEKHLLSAFEREANACAADHPSFLLRSAIEDHEQDRYHDNALNTLISIHRDLLVENAARLRDLIISCLSRREGILRRIAVHVLCERPELFRQQIEHLFADREAVYEMELHHEFYRLMETAYRRVSSNAQQALLSNVWEGAAEDDDEEAVSQSGMAPITSELVERYRDSKRLRRLWALRQERLPAKYADLLSRAQRNGYGDAHPDFHIYIGSCRSVGHPDSPLTAEQLASMSLEEIVAYAKQFGRGGDGFRSPSVAELGSVLADVVAADPERYLELIGKLADPAIHPAYAYYVLSGFRKCLEQGTAFDLSRFLENCAPLLRLSEVQQAGARVVSARDVRLELARFLEHLCEVSESVLSETDMLTVRDLLISLAEDADPGAPGADSEPLAESLNMVRGKAVHGLMRYLLLSHSSSDGKYVVAGSLDERVRECLIRRLEPESEQSLGVKAVFGVYICTLLAMDRSWVVENLRRILPHDPDLFQFWRAAWEGFLYGATSLNDDCLALLVDDYMLAVRNLPKLARPAGYVERFPQHVAILFWRCSSIESADQVVDLFIASADDDLMAQFVPALVRGLDVKEKAQRWERLARFWRSRIKEIASGEPASHQHELAGYLEVIGHVQPSDTVMELVQATIPLLQSPFWSFNLLENLSKWVDSHPVETIGILRACARPDVWPNIHWSDHKLRDLIQKARENGGKDAHAEIIALLDALGDMGDHRLADYLGE